MDMAGQKRGNNHAKADQSHAADTEATGLGLGRLEGLPGTDATFGVAKSHKLRNIPEFMTFFVGWGFTLKKIYGGEWGVDWYIQVRR